MFRLVYLSVFLLSALNVVAQNQLLFMNATTGETVRMREGNKVSLLYKGYNGQQEFVKEIITEITDSTITLGSAKRFNPGKRPNRTYKTIYVKDIIGFRKMGVGRLLAKSAMSIGSIFGSYYMLRGLYSSNIASGYSVIASIGVGLAVIELNELVFPENIKHYMENGWQVAVVQNP